LRPESPAQTRRASTCALGLTWGSIDLDAGFLRVRAQLSRKGELCPLKTPSARRDASHLIVDLGLDVVQVSHQLGHASPTITMSTYAHLFDQARHAEDTRSKMQASEFGKVLEGRPQ
jgi:hypothetical protein